MASGGGFSEALSPSSAVPVRTASHVYASTKKGYYYKVLTATHSGGGGQAGMQGVCVCRLPGSVCVWEGLSVRGYEDGYRRQVSVELFFQSLVSNAFVRNRSRSAAGPRCKPSVRPTVQLKFTSRPSLATCLWSR